MIKVSHRYAEDRIKCLSFRLFALLLL